MAEKKDPPYFMYFPGHYRWSAEMLAILSTAPYGGADLSEVDRIGRKPVLILFSALTLLTAWPALSSPEVVGTNTLSPAMIGEPVIPAERSGMSPLTPDVTADSAPSRRSIGSSEYP